MMNVISQSPWLQELARTLGAVLAERVAMKEEEAVRWLDERKFRYHKYETPACPW